MASAGHHHPNRLASTTFVCVRVRLSDTPLLGAVADLIDAWGHQLLTMGVDLAFQSLTDEIAEVRRDGGKYSAPGGDILLALCSGPSDVAGKGIGIDVADGQYTDASSAAQPPVPAGLWYPAGCIALRPLDAAGPGAVEVKRLFVLPAYRGHDLGRLLSETLLRGVRATRPAGTRVMLDTLRRLTHAGQLYSSLGFRECQPYNFNPHDDVAYMELVV